MISIFCKGNYPALVTVEPCGSRQDNKWVFNNSTQQIELATDPSKCLDIFNMLGTSSRLDGSLIQNSCNGKSNQKWTMENVDLP